MAYAPSTLAPRELAIAARDVTATPVPAGSSRGLFIRFVDALMESRRRQANREIARYLAGGGNHFTDETEREIERHFLGGRARW